MTLVILTLGALAVSADFRKAVYTMIQKFLPIEMQLTYQVDGEPLEQLPDGYSDHYVPDGFERDYEQGYDDAQAFLHVYTDIMTNDFYTVSCAIVQNQNQKELFDNEHTKYRKVKMGDVEALLGEDKNTGYYLVWEDEGITHTIIGRISIRELMLVAQKIY